MGEMGICGERVDWGVHLQKPQLQDDLIVEDHRGK